MPTPLISVIGEILEESIRTKQSLLADAGLLRKIEHCVQQLTSCFEKGGKVYFCGNGGSAADAQHLAAEFTGRFYKNRKALPAEALHCNTSYLTAVANDYSFDLIYERMITGIARKGDVLIGLSTSGNSKNIFNALKAGKSLGVLTIGFTGKEGGQMQAVSDILVNVPSTNTPRIQECHITIGHIICQLVEQAIFIQD